MANRLRVLGLCCSWNIIFGVDVSMATYLACEGKLIPLPCKVKTMEELFPNHKIDSIEENKITVFSFKTNLRLYMFFFDNFAEGGELYRASYRENNKVTQLCKKGMFGYKVF